MIDQLSLFSISPCINDTAGCLYKQLYQVNQIFFDVMWKQEKENQFLTQFTQFASSHRIHTEKQRFTEFHNFFFHLISVFIDWRTIFFLSSKQSQCLNFEAFSLIIEIMQMRSL